MYTNGIINDFFCIHVILMVFVYKPYFVTIVLHIFVT